MQNYEIALIINPDLSKDIDKFFTSFEKMLSDNNFSISRLDDVGRRKLAYSIDDHNKGHYLFYYVEGNPESVSEIENKIKVSPFIKDALVIGDKRKFLSVLIAIEFETVSNWALRKNIPHTTYRDLSDKKEVKDLVWSEILKANAETSSLEIRKFQMIPKELDHEDGEMTATQKIKRNVLMEKFSDLIEEMYS